MRNKSKYIAAGVDIGGTNTVFGWIDTEGKIKFQSSIPTTGNTPEELVQKVCASLRKHQPKGIQKGIGIGAPNGNFYSGQVEFAPNLHWSERVPLVELFQEEIGLPAKLTNDANAAAMGEMQFGSTKGVNDFIFITLGTGVGSGIVSNGQLVYGHDGFAGEIGHIIYDPNGRLCGCGRKGCIETYCSALGIIKNYHEAGGDSSITNSKMIFDRANDGDVAAIKAFKKAGEILGFTLANSVAYTSPKAIVLFGGPTRASDFLLPAIRKSFEENVLKIYKGKVEIRLSALPLENAAILGAASLILNE